MNKYLLKRLVLVAFGCALGSAVAAESTVVDSPALYSRTMPLTVSGKQAVAQLPVPKEVYMATHGVRLGDLRIFDRNGRLVRFAVVEQAEAAVEEVKRTTATIFPVNATATGSDASLVVRASIDGKLVSLDASSAGSKPGASKLASLILDLGGQRGSGASALHLELPPEMNNYTARIAVDVSDDLKQWTNGGEAVVSWLANADNRTLASDRIELDGLEGRYARLRWREGTPLQFAGITVEWRGRTVAPRQRDTLVVTGRPGRFAGDVVYPAARGLPLQSMGLQFEQRNVVTQAQLGHYLEIPVLKQGQPARFDFEGLYRATFYRLEQDGKVRASSDIAARDWRVAEWVLRPDTPLTPAPALRLSWEPARLIFFAAGATPYTLAVGRDDAGSEASDVSQVAPGFAEADLARLELAQVGPVHDQVVAAPSVSDARLLASAARTRTVILWAVLIIGVLAVLLMTRQLMQQMRQPAPADDAGGDTA